MNDELFCIQYHVRRLYDILTDDEFYMLTWLGYGVQLLVEHQSRCFCEDIL